MSMVVGTSFDLPSPPVRHVFEQRAKLPAPKPRRKGPPLEFPSVKSPEGFTHKGNAFTVIKTKGSFTPPHSDVSHSPPCCFPIASRSLFAAMKCKPLEMSTQFLGEMNKRIKAKEKNEWDDKLTGYFHDKKQNDLTILRYPITSQSLVLGEGSFAKVISVRDKESGKLVAAKINLRDLSFGNSIEELIKVARVQGLPHVIQLMNHFQLSASQHVLIFEAVGSSLSETLADMKRRKMHFSMKEIKDFAFKLFEFLAALHRVGIIHCDLKTSNLYLSMFSGDMRILDFGLSQNVFKDQLPVRIGCISYRAPEICIGAKYSFPCDIFSAGCILFKVYTGENLFLEPSIEPIKTLNGKAIATPELAAEARHLASVQQISGPLSTSLVRTGKRAGYFFAKSVDKTIRFIIPPDGPTLPIRMRILAANRRRLDTLSDVDDLIDLVERMVNSDPDKRITALKGLDHPFFTAPGKVNIGFPYLKPGLSSSLSQSKQLKPVASSIWVAATQAALSAAKQKPSLNPNRDGSRREEKKSSLIQGALESLKSRDA